MKSVRNQNQSRRVAGEGGRRDQHRRGRRTGTPDTRATLGDELRATSGAADAVNRGVQQMQVTAETLLNFGRFIEEAKPTEIRLLGEMLGEWQNWGGSLRAGNFFAAVAEAVLHQEPEARLKAWPKDRRKMAAAEAEVRQARSA